VDREQGTMMLTELAPGVTVEEVKSKTDAAFTVADDIRIME
jgi:3-oxoacid CoA-transferase